MAASVKIPVLSIIERFKEYSAEVQEAIANDLLDEVTARAYFAFDDSVAPKNPRKLSPYSGKPISQGARFRGRKNLRRSILKFQSIFNNGQILVGAFAPHAHIMEFGTGLRVSKKTGKVSGHMPATHFFGDSVSAVERRLSEIAEKVEQPTVVLKK